MAARPFLLLVSPVIFSFLIGEISGANPVITNFDEPANFPEDPGTDREVTQFTVTDADGDSVSCAVSPAAPFRAVLDASVWEVQYDGFSVLNYATTKFYSLTIECTDTNGDTSNTVPLFVYIEPNEAPVLNDYPKAIVGPLDVTTFDFSTDVVYTVTGNDKENDPLSFGLVSQTPNIGLFTINSISGVITALRDLQTIQQPSFILTVQASDGKNSIDDFKVLVSLDNINSPPAFRNLPTTVRVREDALGGTTLITLTVEDSTSTPTTTCVTSPIADDFKFSLNSPANTITLTADNLLDHETQSAYRITCTATDGYFTTIKVLTVNVEDVGEGPEFNNNDYFCTITESDQRVNSCDLSLTVTDPEGDALASIGFQTAPDSEKFYFDIDTSRIYFDVDYDVDNNAMPSSLDLILEAVDTTAATATATVHITVVDANDNTCEFDKNVSHSTINQFTVLGQLDDFSITDNDKTSPNNQVVVDVVSSSPSTSSNYITVNPAGQVFYINTIPEANSGSSYTMLVRCRDLGTPSTTSFATVIVSYTYIDPNITTTTPLPTTTPTIPNTTITSTTPEPEKSVWDFDGFIATFASLISLMVLTLIILLVLLCYKCCCKKKSYDTHRKRHRRRRRRDDRSDSSYSSSGFRTDYGLPRAWQHGQAISPRHVPAIETY